MSGKKVLITGGFGNLGSWLSEYFDNMGYDVYILSKRGRNLKKIQYTSICADIADIDNLRDTLSSYSFDYCIHTASYNEFFIDGYPKDALLINSLGTRNLIEVLRTKHLKKFIYFSTFHIYGANAKGIVNEQTLPSPTNDYASTHLFAEYYLKQFYNTHGFPYITLRLTNSYGAPKYKDSSKWYLVLNDLSKSAFEQQRIVIKSNGTPSRDFIWMGDVCDVCEKLLNIDHSDTVFNLSANKTYSVNELALKVQTVYENKYGKKIDIDISKEDTTIYPIVEVDNSKLLEAVDHKFEDKIESEIEKIFSLLEQEA